MSDDCKDCPENKDLEIKYYRIKLEFIYRDEFLKSAETIIKDLKKNLKLSDELNLYDLFQAEIYPYEE